MMSSENKTFSCVLCGSKLLSKEALQEHFRKHANKEIDAKGKQVKKIDIPTEKEKQNKSEENTQKESIECDVCTMKFDTVTQAIQHKFRKHPESSSKFYCPYCGMQFPLKFTRDKHVQVNKDDTTHTDGTKGDFPCPDCGIVFYNIGARTYHVKSTHKRILSLFKPVPTPPPSKKIRINNANEAQSVYYCYLCGSEYIIKFNLQKHLEKSHTEEERNAIPQDLIKCTTCDALFYNKKAYDTHNLYHKPDDLYVTSEEHRLQTVTRVDQDFDIRRVELTADKFIPIDKPKQRRRQHIKNTPRTDAVKKTGFKMDSDEELSPNSSMDSSDSEDEIKSKQKEQKQFIQRRIKIEETKVNIKTEDDTENNEMNEDDIEDIKVKVEEVDEKTEIEKLEKRKRGVKDSAKKPTKKTKKT